MGTAEDIGFVFNDVLEILYEVDVREMKDLMRRIEINPKILAGKSIIHAGLLWASLALAYSSYKGYMRMTHHAVPQELKIAIKETFPWVIIIFVALFVLYGIWRDKQEGYPSFRQYTIILVLQVSIVNLIFSPRGIPILIVQNLACVYFIIFLLVWGGMKRPRLEWAEDILPPIVYRPLKSNMPSVREYCRAYIKEKPSAPFIIGFMALLMLCTLLLILKQEKAAEELANIAYFLLVIGVGIEIYQLIKYGNVDEEKGD